ncbi:MAG: hypothetical protein VZR27_07035 [Acutalibacteraceae bacterium]|nr:hypothetical protein [Acutalibacteraceae bacterium]
MKEIDKILKEELIYDISIKDKTKLFALYDDQRHTVVGNHIKSFKIAVAVLAASVALLGASAGLTLHDAVKARTAGINITREKQNDLEKNASLLGNTPEEYAARSYDINVNENGDTYGHYFDGVDLVSVSGVKENNGCTGYVYREDLDFLTFGTGFQKDVKQIEIDDILKHQQDCFDGKVRNWIYVYEKDGCTVIGKYVHEYANNIIDGNITDEERERILYERFLERKNRVGDFEYGFNTNEQLENQEYQKLLINGSDYQAYEQMAQNRSKTLADKAKESMLNTDK